MLDGTIQTYYRGVAYQTPLSLYIPLLYPLVAPRPRLQPTQDMFIVSGHPHVDPSGNISLPYLTHWKDDAGTLVELVGILCSIFSDSPPLRARTGGTPVREPVQQVTMVKMRAPSFGSSPTIAALPAATHVVAKQSALTPAPAPPPTLSDVWDTWWADGEPPGHTETCGAMAIPVSTPSWHAFEVPAAPKLLPKPSSSMNTGPDSKFMCAICLEDYLGVAFSCGHHCCVNCAPKIHACHMCSQPITMKIKLYF
jgi:hypothetical protein